MKVLALSYLFPNPAMPHYGIFVFNRLKAVQQRCDLKVIAPIQWYPLKHKIKGWAAGQAPIPQKSCLEGMEVHYPRFFVIPKYLKWFDAISYLLAALPIARRLWREGFRFDLIDVHWTYPDILAGYVLSCLYNKPFVVTIRGVEALYPGERGGRKFLLDWLLKKANAVVALSSELAGLCQGIGVAPERISVVLNGIDTEKFRLVETKDSRARIGLDLDKKIIISVGSLIERKGHHEIIKLLPQLKDKFQFDFYILGDVNPEGDFSKKIQSLIEQLDIKNVHLVGNVDHSQLIDWYNAADLFVLATRGEGCPNVVMESLACGTPVVVTNVGAVTDLVKIGEDGFIVDEPASLKELIAKGLETQWDRAEISRRGRARTWYKCALEVLEVYQKVMQLKTRYQFHSMHEPKD